jgi:hypothetical protein
VPACVEGYKQNVDSLVDGVKALPMVNADDEMLLPGEIEGCGGAFWLGVAGGTVNRFGC